MPRAHRSLCRIALAVVLVGTQAAACREGDSGTSVPEPWPAATERGAATGPTTADASAAGEVAPGALLLPGAPAAEAERLDLSGASTLERSGQLAAGAVARYVAYVDAGASMTVETSSVDGTVLPAVTGDDGTSLKFHTDGHAAWTGEVPLSQDYHVTLVNTGAEERAFGLRVALADGAVPDVAAAASADAGAGDAGTGVPALFSPSSRVAMRQVVGGAQEATRYAFTVDESDLLLVAVETGEGESPRVVVRDAEGRRIPGASPGTWRGVLPSAGTYNLEVDGVPSGSAAALAARLVAPQWSEDAAMTGRWPSGTGEVAVASQIPLGAGAFGGGRYRLAPRPGGRLFVDVTTLSGADRAIVTVTDAEGRLVGVLEASEDGEPQSVGPLTGDTMVSLLFPGGASGGTVTYEARLYVE